MRLEFTDAQKAEIYTRDRALCCFSGKSLWILDYGISPTYDVDWVDHIVPAARGGKNNIENGICASSFFNSKKRANSNDNKYFYFSGKPTLDFYYFHEVVPAETADHLARFTQVKASDWYFNRAAYRFMLGLGWMLSAAAGENHIRDSKYYARSALKALQRWKKLSSSQGSFEDRGLLGAKLSQDQMQLLALRDCSTEEQVFEHMESCFHWYAAGCEAIEMLSEAKSTEDFDRLGNIVSASTSMPERIRSSVLENLKRLGGHYLQQKSRRLRDN